jgi:hypothetical protein
VQRELGESEFGRLAADGAELVHAGRDAELVGRFATEPRDQDAVTSPVGT